MKPATNVKSFSYLRNFNDNGWWNVYVDGFVTWAGHSVIRNNMNSLFIPNFVLSDIFNEPYAMENWYYPYIGIYIKPHVPYIFNQFDV